MDAFTFLCFFLAPAASSSGNVFMRFIKSLVFCAWRITCVIVLGTTTRHRINDIVCKMLLRNAGP
jgi:hypothetical protein